MIGESGSGKTTVKDDLEEWIKKTNQPVILIEPYVIGMEDDDKKGKSIKAAHVAEAILAKLKPFESPKNSHEARFRQVHEALRDSSRSGYSHLLVIEEGHSIPIPLLKHFKRFLELKDGLSKLLGICIIGQPELADKLGERNAKVREVVQRCEVVSLLPLDNELEDYLTHRFTMVGKEVSEVMDLEGVCRAMRAKLSRKDDWSNLYPLAVHNIMVAAMNEAAALGVPQVTAELVMGV